MTISNYTDFADFFQKATGHTPYSYQKELANTNDYSIINIPTGAGKTELAVLCLWLWKRMNTQSVPKRLVYCLPMRVLVEQTYEKITHWIKNLDLEEKISVEMFMGGNDTKIEKILPNKECIIIGTQDIIMSGALNRAYGSSPATWPIVFGLLNNDCMWVMDEIQIMENTLPTSMQMNSFRDALGTFGPHKTIWMSATINPDWMKTVDFHASDLQVFNLENSKIETDLKERHFAAKKLHKAPFTIKKEYDTADIKKMLDLHVPGTTTAIIVNTVKRAQSVYKTLSQYHNCKLIHSRFRGAERQNLNALLSKLKEQEDQIIVSTQVIEAGVDMSVRTMITELAPWANMVQRFGRCNRYGKLSDADVYWIDMDDDVYPPYESKSMMASRTEMKKFSEKSVSPGCLSKSADHKAFDSILRKRDIVGLFDTTSDLSGGHIDVSQFVRNKKSRLDVGVFWRDLNGNISDQLRHGPDEICDVSIFDLKNFLKGKKGWIWKYTDKTWENITPNDIFPGQIIMLDCATTFGYSKVLGWDMTLSEQVEPISKSTSLPESHDGDAHSQLDRFVTLATHTKHVMDEIKNMLENDQYISDNVKNALFTAAKYHDVGKAHHVFQNAIRKDVINDNEHIDNQIWAKGKFSSVGYERTGFRHEVVSMLVYLGQNDNYRDKLRDLIAYLIVSHHGKVRLSLGTTKTKFAPADNSFLLGIAINGETFPKYTSASVSTSETRIDMSLANMGRDSHGNPSWSERVLKLRDEYGPFCLSYLEALLRRADWLASEKEGKGVYTDE